LNAKKSPMVSPMMPLMPSQNHSCASGKVKSMAGENPKIKMITRLKSRAAYKSLTRFMAPASACLAAAVNANVPAVQQHKVAKAASKPVFI
jgi:hypothetical protein